MSIRPIGNRFILAVLLGVLLIQDQGTASGDRVSETTPIARKQVLVRSEQPLPPAKTHGSDSADKSSEKIKAPSTPDVGRNLLLSQPLLSEITGKDGAPMVLVPAGDFMMGSDKGDEDESPIHRVYLHAFYIDKFEVTNGRFAKFVEVTLAEPPWGFADKDTPIISADRPVRWVSWMDAMSYCLWAGKRLPTEAEWEKAARGNDGRMYPWGNDPPTLAHAVYGLKEGGAEMISAIGNRERGASPYGAHDMAGNLYEWVMDWYGEEYYTNFSTERAVNPRGPSEGTGKVQRGGSYINSPYRLRSSFRTKGDPSEQDQNVGFRCAQDVPMPPQEISPGVSPVR